MIFDSHAINADFLEHRNQESWMFCSVDVPFHFFVGIIHYFSTCFSFLSYVWSEISIITETFPNIAGWFTSLFSGTCWLELLVELI